MFASEFVLGSVNAPDALALRKRVFVEELGWEDTQAFTDIDALAAHLMVRVEGETVAAARMFPVQGGVCLDCACVAPNWRKQRFFDLCVRLMLNKAANMGTARVYITTDAAYIAYYAAFGFLTDAEENGVCEMSIDPENIVWHSACGGKKE